jgi:hypothetical protein
MAHGRQVGRPNQGHTPPRGAHPRSASGPTTSQPGRPGAGRSDRGIAQPPARRPAAKCILRLVEPAVDCEPSKNHASSPIAHGECARHPSPSTMHPSSLTTHDAFLAIRPAPMTARRSPSPRRSCSRPDRQGHFPEKMLPRPTARTWVILRRSHLNPHWRAARRAATFGAGGRPRPLARKRGGSRSVCRAKGGSSWAAALGGNIPWGRRCPILRRSR